MIAIAIGCPIRNRAWILPAYLAALEAVDHSDKQYLFMENDSTDDTRVVLDSWYARPKRVRCHRTQRPAGHQRNEYGLLQYGHLANIRNLFLDLFLETEAAYLLSVDSDVIVPPDILNGLLPLANQQTIVGAPICNMPGQALNGNLPGNFMIEKAGLFLHPPTYPLTGTMEVAMTGACYLIPRTVIEGGVRYGAYPQGEDLSFCLAARAAGARILVSFDVRPEHRMVEDGQPCTTTGRPS